MRDKEVSKKINEVLSKTFAEYESSRLQRKNAEWVTKETDKCLKEYDNETDWEKKELLYKKLEELEGRMKRDLDEVLRSMEKLEKLTEEFNKIKFESENE